ncbi:MAG: hypothetical protein JWP91_1490 [Fibrobacteres bacterium]|nr:hypothetical protein [Fibrobacterota bacterium]
MMSLTLRPKSMAALGLFVLVPVLALPGIGRGQVSIDPVQVYTVSPNPAPAGARFTLSLNGGAFPCVTSFSRESVTVTGNRIDLTFQANSGIMVPVDDPYAAKAIPPICMVDDMAVQPAIPQPIDTVPIFRANVPAFAMPALKAGAYEVWATQVYACQFTQPACLVKSQPQYAGTLKTGAATREGWFLKNEETLADKAFPMQLLNNLYGNCQTTFTHLTHAEAAGNISVSFVVETDKNRVCVQDIIPWGPVVEMPALKAGIYPVYVQTLPACLFTEPRCMIDLIPNPRPSDTLVVTKSLAILMSSLRAGGLTAAFQGSRVDFDLPRDNGNGKAADRDWRAELMTLSGRRLAFGAAHARAGERAGLDLAVRPGPGVYLIRLTAADGESHILPVHSLPVIGGI